MILFIKFRDKIASALSKLSEKWSFLPMFPATPPSFAKRNGLDLKGSPQGNFRNRE